MPIFYVGEPGGGDDVEARTARKALDKYIKQALADPWSYYQHEDWADPIIPVSVYDEDGLALSDEIDFTDWRGEYKGGELEQKLYQLDDKESVARKIVDALEELQDASLAEWFFDYSGYSLKDLYREVTTRNDFFYPEDIRELRDLSKYTQRLFVAIDDYIDVEEKMREAYEAAEEVAQDYVRDEFDPTDRWGVDDNDLFHIAIYLALDDKEKLTAKNVMNWFERKITNKL